MFLNRVHAKRHGPLRVLHIAPTPFFSDRGGHVRIKGIIEALNQKAVKNILCTYHHGRDVTGIETIRTARIPGYTKQEAGPSPFKYLADILLFFKIYGAIRKHHPDIIHGHLHEGALVGWAAKTCFFWRRIPLIFDVQGSLVGELSAHGYFGRLRILRRLFWLLEYVIARLPEHFCCSSLSSAELLRTRLRVAPEKIAVVHDGADVGAPDEIALTRLRARIDLPENRPIILYTGGLSRAKGLDVLCQVISIAAKRRIGCHFLVVGYPEEPMRIFAKRNHLEHICTITGRGSSQRGINLAKLAANS
jgi:glycosyltransferase involved in cell wall biosynthesis